MKRVRPIEPTIGPSIAYVPLTRGQYALIDAEDLPAAARWNWHAYYNKHTKSYYAKRFMPDERRVLPLHLEVMNLSRGTLVDHRNGETLDNRKCNLRQATFAQNTYNARIRRDSASGIKGVRWVPANKKWQARITVSGRRMSLGLYMTKEGAANAYKEAALHHAREFARIA